MGSDVLQTRRQQMTTGGIDGYSNFMGDDSEYRDWYGFVGRSRDSGQLELSNYAVAVARLEEIDPSGDDWREESYGHWACGWVEEVYVRPGSACQDYAEECAAALADYPVLDEMDFCERESEEADRVWQDCYSESERVEYMRQNRSQFDFADWADLRAQVRGEYFRGYASELIS